MKEKDGFKAHYSRKEVKELMNTYSLKLRNDLRYDSTDIIDYYELPDGRILLTFQDHQGGDSGYINYTAFKFERLECCQS